MSPSPAHPTAAHGRSVLVTGAAVRLGAQICRAFARAGWDVWCHYHRSADTALALCEELAAMGVQARTVAADLASAEDRQRMMEHIVHTSGPLSCLVNNASTFEPDEAQTLDSASTQHQLNVNLVAPMELSALMARSLPVQEHRGRHSVIHILDQKVFNLNPDYFSYTLSKLALERAVALQAQALADKLRVCGVAPGLMFLSGPQSQENFDMAGRINPMRRPTNPDQVARSCVFLAENDAITGVTLAVDNGQHLVPLPNDVMVVVDHYLQKP
ncbi:SDR family oxidoreductase [Curvibacter sp. APW13]|uniref:SDR family oxidoreductase n=1 Tax=Curvibacter sp. APW13 TaxID=3077236 RepID=UPI0028DD70D8|nr:SDR family oxidoreductase [Curvibacter sp. APW13]MDT8992995.1 SDR family oxidoreductase [Curvibacter sp. APW13]